MKHYNPFKYTGVVTGSDFVNRTHEINELMNDMLAAQNIILHSPRRYGKTSLIFETFRRIGKDAITSYIDLYGTLTEEDIAQRMVNGLVMSTYTSIDRLKKGLKELFVAITPQIIIERGETRIRILWDGKRTWENLDEIFELPQKVAEKNKGKMVIVAFDEFQELRAVDGERIEKLMRTHFQHHKDVAYLFAGSKVSILLDMFENVVNPFYKLGKPFPLRKIPAEELTEFITEKFELTGKSIEHALVEKIIELTGCHPYFTQMLAYEVWAIGDGEITEEHLREAVTRIIARNTDAYLHIFDGLTRYQRILLAGLCKDPNITPYSKEFAERYRMTPAYVQSALAGLKGKRLIENGELSDVFFKEWVKQRFGH